MSPLRGGSPIRVWEERTQPYAGISSENNVNNTNLRNFLSSYQAGSRKGCFSSIGTSRPLSNMSSASWLFFCLDDEDSSETKDF